MWVVSVRLDAWIYVALFQNGHVIRQAANTVLPEAICTLAKFNHSALTIVSIDLMLSSSYQ